MDMKFKKMITFGLATAVTILSTSCGVLPELPSAGVGPQSSESEIPWNRRLQNEGQGALGGLGAR